LLSQGEARTAHFDHFKRRLDLCQAFGIPTLLLVADFAERVDETALQRAVVSLRQAAQWARVSACVWGWSFAVVRRYRSALPTAMTLIHAAGEPNLGICLDVFHYYTGPSKFEDLGLLTPQTLAHVQVCDLAGVGPRIGE
jgi:4-hydroxyphenylpyruvate dioxygenase